MSSDCAIIRSMSEIWDVVDLNHTPVGMTVQRGHEAMQWLKDQGYYHVVVLGFIISHRKLIVTRRALGKSAGGYYEVTGGSVLAGENSMDAIKREWKEEIGYDPTDHMVLPLPSFVHHVDIYDPFVVFDDDTDFTNPILQKEEVDQLILMDDHQLDQIIKDKKAVDCLIYYRDQIHQWLNQ